MTIHQLLAMILARRDLAVSVFLSVLALAITVTLVLPKSYTASAAVHVDGKGLAVDPLAGVALPGIVSTGFIATQADLMASDRVIRRAIKLIHADTDPAYHELWLQEADGAGDKGAWLAEKFRKGLEIKPSRESSVIQVEYSSQRPKLSADMANALVRAYIDLTLDMRVEPAKQYRALFDQRAAALKKQLDVAQTKVRQYQEQNGIVPTDERIDVESARLVELNSQLVALQSLNSEANARQQLSANQTGSSQEVMNNQLVATLTADLSRQESRREELMQRYGAEYPELKAVLANIAQLKSRVAAESARVAGSMAVAGAINRAKLAQLNAAVEEQRRRLQDLKVKRDTAANLIRDVDSAQKSLDAVQARMSQVDLESENKQTNVTVVKSASVPMRPSSPSIGRNLLAGSIIGGALAMVVAFLRELLSPRLLTNRDVEVGLKVPLMALMPRVQGPMSSKKGWFGLSLPAPLLRLSR